jgi:hypothetical protein
MKKNGIRLAKLEDRLVVNGSDKFKLSDFELLERIEECEFQLGREPTQKLLDMKKVADRTRPTLTPKDCQRLKAEQAERHAHIEAMSEEEVDDRLNKLTIENGMEGTFEDMNDHEIEVYNKSGKETLV